MSHQSDYKLSHVQAHFAIAIMLSWSEGGKGEIATWFAESHVFDPRTRSVNGQRFRHLGPEAKNDLISLTGEQIVRDAAQCWANSVAWSLPDASTNLVATDPKSLNEAGAARLLLTLSLTHPVLVEHLRITTKCEALRRVCVAMLELSARVTPNELGTQPE